jgi:hypothetical protein
MKSWLHVFAGRGAESRGLQRARCVEHAARTAQAAVACDGRQAGAIAGSSPDACEGSMGRGVKQVE